MSNKILEWIARMILGNQMVETYKFPKTLAEFGYEFNEDGQLRKIDPATGRPGSGKFEFVVKPDNRRYNQKHYEAIGEVIGDRVYEMMEEMGLERHKIPFDAKPTEPQSFFFASRGAFDGDKPLLILVHGSGVVLAGQWARSLIINDCLDTGSQIPYIKKGIELGYGIVVANTNDNYRQIKQKELPIRDGSLPEDHIKQIWDNYIVPSKVKKVAVVAHSYGGLVIAYLCWERLAEFKNRVFAAAMTDSVHFGCKIMNEQEAEGRAFLKTVGYNWKASDQPLGTPVENAVPDDVPSVSAGHPKHEMTSASAIDAVFAFIEDRRNGITQAPAPVVQVGELVNVEENPDKNSQIKSGKSTLDATEAEEEHPADAKKPLEKHEEL